MLINDNKPVEPIEKKRTDVTRLNILLEMRDPPRSDARVRIEKEVAIVMDFREVSIPRRRQFGSVLDYTISRNPQEIGEERIVAVAPGLKVACHWINSEVAQKLASLKKLEEGAFPMIQGIAEVR